jgi:hypothetical protein
VSSYGASDGLTRSRRRPQPWRDMDPRLPDAKGRREAERSVAPPHPGGSTARALASCPWSGLGPPASRPEELSQHESLKILRRRGS